MFRFEDVIGHENLIEHLQSAIAMKKISHAYMLQGEKLSGKKMVADLFARALHISSISSQLLSLSNS